MNDQEKLARERTAPATMNLLEVLQNRNMPTERVDIYIDEGAQWEVQQLQRKLGDETDAERVKLLETQLESARRAVLDSKVTLTLRAINSRRYDELVAEAKERFPVKYEKTANPLTGKTSVEEVPSEDREEFFNLIFLADTLVSAEYQGAIDENITPEWFKGFMELAPVDAVRKVFGLAFEMRMAGEWIDAVQDEDFSARP